MFFLIFLVNRLIQGEPAYASYTLLKGTRQRVPNGGGGFGVEKRGFGSSTLKALL